MWRIIVDIYILVVVSLYREMTKIYSRDSLSDSNNLYHFQRCNQVFMSNLTYTNSQNSVYRQ